MKLAIDPMPALRKAAVARVNGYFNSLVQPHRDAAWARKREIAKAAAPYPDGFAQEAELRGITQAALASLILSKGDPLEDRELQRQRTMVEIDAAPSPSALSAVVDKLLTS